MAQLEGHVFQLGVELIVFGALGGVEVGVLGHGRAFLLGMVLPWVQSNYPRVGWILQ